MQYRRFFVLVLVLMLAVVVSLPVTSQTDSAVVVSWTQEPDSLNPMYTTMTFAGYTYQLYLAPAWNLDADLNPHPVLVSEIPSVDNGGINEEGTVFTLRLNEGMTWSDGEPLTSADFVFTYEMIVSEQNTPLSISPYDRIASVEAPDETTVVVNFEEPFAAWLALFSYVLPEHVLRPVFESEGTLDGSSFDVNPPVASGPYVFEEWDSGNFMRFSANPNFVGGTANIETMIVTFIPDDQAYVASLLAGQSQVGSFVPPSEVASLEAAGLIVSILPSGYSEGWFFNVSEEHAHPAMLDVRVREAIALGFNRFAVIEDLTDGIFPPTASYWEGTPYANPNLSPVPYDPDRARQLLDEAGWVDTNGDGVRDMDGVELELRFATTTRQLRRDIQAIAQQQLGEIGISLILDSYEANIFFNGYAEGGPVATGQYDIAEWSSSVPAFPDPSTFTFTCGEIPTDDSPVGGNWNYYCNPELDALFDRQATTTDFDERVAIFHEIDEILYNEYIWVGVYLDADIWVVSSELENVNINGVTPFWDVVNWQLAQ